jgi:hypothetical protein
MLFLYLYIKKSKQATLRVRLFTFLIYCWFLDAVNVEKYGISWYVN